jgi:tRNA-2-methylthio-N6-dimethylallyladenosine synthase
MRRSYRSARYLAILAEVREAMPDAAITTDIIVGFPGETDDDFEQTLDVARESRFAGAFTFQYSPRPGTPAATLPDQVPPDVVAERFGRLTEVVTASTLAENRRQVGRTVEVLVSAGEGRKDQASGRLTGRGRDGRLVHFEPGGRVDGAIRPGDLVQVRVTRAAPHHLIADDGVLAHRRTRAGDRSEEGRALLTPGVGLGMPSMGRPDGRAEPAACPS